MLSVLSSRPVLPEQFLFRHSQAGHQQQFWPFLSEHSSIIGHLHRGGVDNHIVICLGDLLN